jgi:hypothetical protein
MEFLLHLVCLIQELHLYQLDLSPVTPEQAKVLWRALAGLHNLRILELKVARDCPDDKFMTYVSLLTQIRYCRPKSTQLQLACNTSRSNRDMLGIQSAAFSGPLFISQNIDAV